MLPHVWKRCRREKTAAANAVPLVLSDVGMQACVPQAAAALTAACCCCCASHCSSAITSTRECGAESRRARASIRRCETVLLQLESLADLELTPEQIGRRATWPDLPGSWK